MEIADETELEEYSVEIDILSQCRHKNIVGIYEAYYINSKLCVSILLSTYLLWNLRYGMKCKALVDKLTDRQLSLLYGADKK